MPLRKKKKTHVRAILIWAAVAVILVLMLISFPATNNITEIVLYP